MIAQFYHEKSKIDWNEKLKKDRFKSLLFMIKNLKKKCVTYLPISLIRQLLITKILKKYTQKKAKLFKFLHRNIKILP
jgi:hypothetical protein